MTMFLRQSTASQEILLGRFVDATDGDTEETALTINNTDIKIWKHGATTLASKNSGGATHIANGNYYAVLDATDTDTIGNLEVHVHVAGALAVKREFVVLDEAVYDVLVGTTAPSTYAGADTSGTTTLLSRLSSARAGYLDNLSAGAAALEATAQSILTDTAEIGVAGAGLTNINLPDQTMNITGDITGNLSGSVGSVAGNVGGNVTGTIGGLTAAALADFFDTNSGTTYGSAIAGSVVKEIADNAGGTPPTAGAIADAVWDEARADHVAAGSFGQGAASVQGNVTGSVASVTGAVTVGTNNDKTGYSLTAGTGLGNQTADITGNLSGSVGSVTGNVGGNVTGTIGSISGVTFPTNFASLAITGGGIVDADVETIKGQAVTCPAGVTVGVYVGGTGESALEATAQSILTDTAEIGVAGAGLTAAGLSAAGVRTAVGLAAANLDTQLDALPTAAENASAVMAGTCDTGVSLAKMGEMLAALAAGKVSASSSGGVTTLTYKKRDGSTTSFTVVVTESNNTRATTGSLS